MNNLEKKQHRRRPFPVPAIFLVLAVLLAGPAGTGQTTGTDAKTAKPRPPAENKTIDNETIKIMPFVADRTTCLECHDETEMSTRCMELPFPCDNICLKCHKKEMKAHHSTGMAITFKTRGTLRLGTGNRLTCISCHDLTIPRYSRRAKKAQSLFQRMFKSKSKYKSYYLVMDNRKGQLCKICH